MHVYTCVLLLPELSNTLLTFHKSVFVFSGAIGYFLNKDIFGHTMDCIALYILVDSTEKNFDYTKEQLSLSFNLQSFLPYNEITSK